MFDAINDIPLNNTTKQWSVHISSTFRPDYSNAIEDISIPGADGYVASSVTAVAPAVVVAVITPKARIEELRALMTVRFPRLRVLGGTREAVGTLRSLTEKLVMKESQQWVVVSAIFEIPGVFMRDITPSTSAAASLGASSVTVKVFNGISGPVSDAIIRVKGSATALRIYDSGGSFLQYTPNIPAGSYFRFESATGRAFVTTSDLWTGGNEVTASVVNGAGPLPFVIVPTFTDPATRYGELVITTSARSASTIEVRGKGSYLV